ncbi:MAG: divergent polysaccharide deacetylase family protein [Pseudomonadota bacterium]
MDDLNKPLGQNRKTDRKPLSLDVSKPIIGLCAAAIVGAGAWSWWITDPMGGEPQSIVSLNTLPQGQSRRGVDRMTTGSTQRALRQRVQSRERTYTTSDPNQPARLTAVTPRISNLKGEVIIRDPSAINQPQSLTHLPLPELIEQSSFGPLPVRAASGLRPLDAYARPASGYGRARIAIVVGGLGLSQTGTQNAIRSLPADITLGFSALGFSLKRWSQKARQDGHELVLQIPMEPTNYETNNPGNHTLLADANEAENAASLRWLLARMTNYTGVMNYLGSKLSLTPEALSPILEEVEARGLAYFDDGSITHSVSPQLADKLKLPFERASITLDAVRSKSAIAGRLRHLEQLARRQGSALGVASAFPVSVQQIAEWSQEAKSRGIEIVPVSALVRQQNGS